MHSIDLIETYAYGRSKDLVSGKISYFAVAKNIRPNSTHYFIMRVSNKQELQQIGFNRSSDISFIDFINL